nr:MAG TPA: hypothetical protein [Caudoviricetes sp.]
MQHDRSTDEYYTGTNRTRAAPLDEADQHTPPPFHTPQQKRRTPSTLHLTLFTFTQSTNNHDQRLINECCSLIDQ